MLWILIITTFNGGIATAEFSSRERCEAAIVAVRTAVRNAYTVNAVCVER